MGNDNTKIKKSEFSDILQGVRYTPEEISKIHKSFLLNFPKGKISRLNFLTTYSKMFENYAEAQEFTDHMFRAYDENKDGEISFKEFLITLNTKNKGTKEDKLRWAFRMYDVDGNKQISHAEIIDILTALYKAKGQKDAQKKALASAKEIMKLDTDRNGVLSEDEFVNGSVKNAEIAQLLQGK